MSVRLCDTVLFWGRTNKQSHLIWFRSTFFGAKLFFSRVYVSYRRFLGSLVDGKRVETRILCTLTRLSTNFCLHSGRMKGIYVNRAKILVSFHARECVTVSKAVCLAVEFFDLKCMARLINTIITIFSTLVDFCMLSFFCLMLCVPSLISHFICNSLFFLIC